ncbi:mechanosensitive ion channel family protein [Corynebacterium uropygiale]|uniref:Mechanosensitive ion channel family protein n=1 Tax=Corynebacterium uropygiale TaxID=1775911 RepID=A0A9X1QTF8_9CORY|nr:mechanosensitive ion channel family protein [Corynebacterium uropygiale]MCF4007453.1 mechanosensitive ion channel family protein [Corynebacterium uropygiale]
MTNSLQVTTNHTVQSVTSWWQSPEAKDWLLQKPIEILIGLVIAIVLHVVLRRLIDKAAQHNIDSKGKLPSLARKRRERDSEPSAELRALDRTQLQRRKARIRTLANVGKSAVAIVVWTWFVINTLDVIEINIAPLIASAGVVGVALGFGAQSLVKDFISGIFMLIEDQYGVGDTIDVGDGIVGEVEEVSLRLTTIRDIDGTLWYVRNGEIMRVGNFSDEYSIARLQIPVGLSNDPEKAWEVIQDSVRRWVKDPSIAESIIGEPEMKGVSDFEVDHLSYRIQMRTLPGHQWDVQRFLQGKVLNDMTSAGVSTPYPHGIGGWHPSMKEEKEGSES